MFQIKIKFMKNHFGIKLICFGTTLAYRLYIFVCILIILIGIAMATNIIGDNFQLRVNLPFSVNYVETGHLELNNTSIDVKFENAYGKVHFVDTPLFLAWKFWMAMLVVMVIGFYALFTLRRFIKSVREGRLFESGNIFLLQRISYSIIALWFFAIIYDRIFYHAISKNIQFKDLVISDSFNYYPGIIILAVSIWLFAFVINEGVNISDENKLTI